MLPNLFGEGARPRYNNVTATFIEALIKGAPAKINKNSKIPMLHVGAAAEIAINAVADRLIGSKKIDARLISVADLFAKLQEIHRDYSANIFPNLQDLIHFRHIQQLSISPVPTSLPASIDSKFGPERYPL